MVFCLKNDSGAQLDVLFDWVYFKDGLKLILGVILAWNTALYPILGVLSSWGFRSKLKLFRCEPTVRSFIIKFDLGFDHELTQLRLHQSLGVNRDFMALKVEGEVYLAPLPPKNLKNYQSNYLCFRSFDLYYLALLSAVHFRLFDLPPVFILLQNRIIFELLGQFYWLWRFSYLVVNFPGSSLTDAFLTLLRLDLPRGKLTRERP